MQQVKNALAEALKKYDQKIDNFVAKTFCCYKNDEKIIYLVKVSDY